MFYMKLLCILTLDLMSTQFVQNVQRFFFFNAVYTFIAFLRERVSVVTLLVVLPITVCCFANF